MLYKNDLKRTNYEKHTIGTNKPDYFTAAAQPVKADIYEFFVTVRCILLHLGCTRSAKNYITYSHKGSEIYRRPASTRFIQPSRRIVILEQ